MTKIYKDFILIYGATGFVGKALVRYLASNNYKLIIIARNVTKAKKIFGDTVRVLSVEDSYFISENCRAIVNLAGSNIGAKAWTKKNKERILKSRIDSVEFLENLIKKKHLNPEVWVQASAIGFYGHNVDLQTDESGKKGKGFLAHVVSEWEQAFQEVKVESMRKLVLRLGIVMSKNDGFLRQMLKMSNMGAVVLPSKKEQFLAWIHINDLIRIIELIINNETHGTINAVAPYPLLIDELKDYLLLNSNAIVKFSLPNILFQFFLGKEKTNEMLLASQNIISSVLSKSKFNYQFNNFNQVFENSNG